MSKQPEKRLNREDQDFVLDLMNRYEPDLRKVVRGTMCELMPDEDMINDVLQDTYEAMCRQVDSIRTVEKKRAYIRTIATRCAIQECKRLTKNLPLEEDYPAPAAPPDGLDELLPKSTPSKDRRLLTQVYAYGNTPLEVARDTGENCDAVRQRLKRARDRLKRKMRK